MAEVADEFVAAEDPQWSAEDSGIVSRSTPRRMAEFDEVAAKPRRMAELDVMFDADPGRAVGGRDVVDDVISMVAEKLLAEHGEAIVHRIVEQHGEAMRDEVVALFSRGRSGPA